MYASSLKSGLFLIFLSLSIFLQAQVVYTDPFFPTLDGNISIIFNADEGNGALAGFSGDVYAHTGVITSQSTSPSDWKFVVSDWGTDDPKVKMTRVNGDQYKLDITSIRDYYELPGGEEVLRLAFVFRNQDGSIVGRSSTGSDIFYDVYADNQLRTRFLKPEANVVSSLGSSIEVFAAASTSADLKLYDNDDLLESTSDNAVQRTINISTGGFHEVKFIATANNESDTSIFTYIVPANITPQDPPAGTKLGINYTSNSSIVLRLHAPDKSHVFVMGDFNDWIAGDAYQMTPSLDGDDYWIEITGLNPGEIYTFQYLVDGLIKIADPYSTLVLDPNNDGFISNTVYPNLPEYPNGKTDGIVSVIQPGQTPYNWQTTSYTVPEKKDLVIYELLMRDLLESRSYKDLLDTLNYFEKLGINAIKIMPVNEFEGNDSWGYNPSYHMALDKYYGDENTFKAFIDEAHARGIMVILDVVYNHAFSQSPLAQLYWDAVNFRPTLQNPWLNPTARHPFNVGYDFNHESQATKDFIDRVMTHWLEEYNIDGFRFDLSKGFTQTFTGGNVGQWSDYDASRVALLKRIADVVWSANPEAYVILEHFADNDEEKELAEYGMMLWGNINHEFNEASMGYDSRFSWADYTTRGWNVPHLISYMESHDEERLMYKNLQFGNEAGSYSVKDRTTALNRQELVSTFFYAIPGPKMLWQFGELGFEFSINRCTDGSVNSNCRLAPKPPVWEYYNDDRRKRLFHVTQAMINLKQNYAPFLDGSLIMDVDDSGNEAEVKSIQRVSGSEMATIIGNFKVEPGSTTGQIFGETGIWYDYFTGDSIEVTDQSMSINLAPGEYHIYTNSKLPEPEGGFISVVTSIQNQVAVQQGLNLSIYPNPSEGQFNINIESGITGLAQIELKDMLGRTVANSLSQRLQRGQQTISWDTNRLSTGIYWLQLSIGDAVVTEKVVVK